MKKGLIVLTGAARGIGHATTRALVRDHDRKVLAISRNGDLLKELQGSFDGEDHVETLAIDIAEADAAHRIKQAVAGRRIEALVHNAGTLHVRPLGDHRREELLQTYMVNAIAPLEISQALIQELDGDPPGHIVHISSMGGFQDSAKFPGLVAYSSSKAALACMAQCLAEELKGRGIRSNCLALGSVDTEMLRTAFPGYRTPMGAIQMGAFIARFALEGHQLFNGKVLPVATTTP